MIAFFCTLVLNVAWLLSNQSQYVVQEKEILIN